MENKGIVFVADIADDIDDAIAIEWLQINGFLKCAVLDGKSNSSERENRLAGLGVIFENKIPEDTKIVFCGGSFTKIAEFVENNELDLLVANGGFAGSNIVDSFYQLKKFKNKDKVRTYNFNMDVEAALKVLNSPKIGKIKLVSKNVCHHENNVHGDIHVDEFLHDYKLPDGKRLHDLLMVKEGIAFAYGSRGFSCAYKQVDIVCDRKTPDNMSLWGSIANDSSRTYISIGLY